jgi:hypothetical protein
MSGALTSLIAVAGTLLGSVATYVFQRSTAGRAERFTRDERLRQERLAAYSAFAEAVMEYRHEQLTQWLRRHGELTEPSSAAAEQGRQRATAWQARYRVQLLTDDPELIELADEAIDAIAGIHRSQDPADLEQHGKDTRQRVERFIRAASADIR